MPRPPLALAACLLLVAPCALADRAAPSRGLYVSAELGYRTVDVDEGDFDGFAVDRLGELGLAASTEPGSVDDGDPSYGIALGYRLTRRFAVELGYTDYGSVGYEADATATGTVGDVTLDDAPGSLNATVDVAAVSLSVVGRQPVTSQVDLYGRLGVLHSLVDNRAIASFQQGSGEAAASLSRDIGNSGSDQSLAWGLGAAWRFDDGLELRLDYGGVTELGGSGPVDDAGLQRLAFGIVYSL